jgi:cytochrome c oxidase subunit III
VASGSYKESLDSFFITIFLGLIFMYFQINEYYDATFNLQDGIYASTFYMLTGLHGCHVVVGIAFLIVSMVALLRDNYLRTHYLRLVFAI